MITSAALSRIHITEQDTEREVVFTVDGEDINVNGILTPSFEGEVTCTCEFQDGSTPPETSTMPSEDLGGYIAELTHEHALRSPGALQVPAMSWTDITEQLLLGSYAIPSASLSDESGGILSGSGRRTLEFTFENVPEDLLSGVNSVRLHAVAANGVPPHRPVSFQTAGFHGDGTSRFLVDVDTDKLATLFEMPDFGQRTYLTVKFLLDIEATLENSTVMLRYPVQFALVNTDPTVFTHASKHAASVDFGTTSTCVAIDTPEGPELLTVAEHSVTSNRYENPTNLMVFDWKKLYSKWVQDNDSVQPTLFKGGSPDNAKWNNRHEGHPVHFDFGHPVKEELGHNLPTSQTINSILSRLKMIPYRVLHENRQIQFNPFNEADDFIYVTTSPETQDESHFDPVAFYGYLIGRMINDRSKRTQVHTQFQVTSPVKFDDDVRGSIERSLLHGLRRSVPKPLRSTVSIETRYPEPVAYIAAVCGKRGHLRLTDEEQRFAVFDFGGGTLDFAFGTVSCDEDDETVIDVADLGGDESIGGERIIDRLTFQLGIRNMDKLNRNNIPIGRVPGERVPSDLDPRLTAESPYSKANASILSHLVARPLFEGRLNENDTTVRPSLYDLDGNTVTVDLTVDPRELRTYEEQLIDDAVAMFAREMDAAFGITDPHQRSGIHVFLAGNGSRNSYVEKTMIRVLEQYGCVVSRPGGEPVRSVQSDPDALPQEAEAQQDEPARATGRRRMKSQRQKTTTVDVSSAQAAHLFEQHTLTPKTAVALGQLELPTFIVNMDDSRFRLYLAFFVNAKGRFNVPVIKGDAGGTWRRFKKVVNGKVRLYYSEHPLDDEQVDTTPFVDIESDQNGSIMYVRTKGNYAIEYCFGDFDDPTAIPADVQVLQLDFTPLMK